MKAELNALEPYPRALADAVLAVYEQWLLTRVDNISRVAGCRIDDAHRDTILNRAQEAHRWLENSLVVLLSTDVDEQRKGPLQVIRESSMMLNEVLRDLGVAELVRDEFDARALPDDVFGIGPVTWLDLGEAVHEAGIEWGAWKAATVLQRRRKEGKLDG